MRSIYLLLILSAACNDVEMNVSASNPETTSIKPEAEEKVEPAIDKTKSCPSRVVDPELLKRVRAALVDHSNRGKFLSWEDTYGNENGDPANVRVVYVYKGVRYTLWHNPTRTSTVEVAGETIPVHYDGHIAVWERPNGSRGQQAIDTYSDSNFTGCVDFGIGDESRLGEDQHHMRWQSDIGEDHNIYYHDYWQNEYTMAIEGLAHTLGIE